MQLTDLGSVPAELLSSQDDEVIQTRTITIGGTSYYQAYMLWRIERESVLILGVALSREGTVTTIRQTITSIIGAAVLFFLTAGALGYLVVTRLVALIKMLTAAVSEIGLNGTKGLDRTEREMTLHLTLGQYLDRQITGHSNDEIGVLTRTFNIMAGQLHSLIGNLETQVAIRTQELSEANQQLQDEILEREQIQRELVRARDELEMRVQEQTLDLKVINEALRIEIAERKQTEDSLQRVNRELRAVSKCNQTLRRTIDEQSLLDDICRIVCDEAGYRMAWVGYAEHDDARTIQPVTWAGFDSGYIANAQLSWAFEDISALVH